MNNNFTFKIPYKRLIITCKKLKNKNWRINCQSLKYPDNKILVADNCTPHELELFIELLLIKSEYIKE